MGLANTRIQPHSVGGCVALPPLLSRLLSRRADDDSRNVKTKGDGEENQGRERGEVTVWLTSHNTTSTDLIAAGIRALSDREVLQLFGMYKVGATLLHT